MYGHYNYNCSYYNNETKMITKEEKQIKKDIKYYKNGSWISGAILGVAYMKEGFQYPAFIVLLAIIFASFELLYFLKDRKLKKLKIEKQR